MPRRLQNPQPAHVQLQRDRPHRLYVQHHPHSRLPITASTTPPSSLQLTHLLSGILAHTSEVTKSEFGTVAVMLGLLPGVLQLIGPKLSDLSLLATRRPLLSLFLTLGSPCPALDYETTGMEAMLEPDAAPYWPAYLRKQHAWVTCLVSALEYLLVAGAAGNVVYQFYRLTFYAVVLISTQLGQYGGTLEAFAPLLWVFLGVPIHAVGVVQICWCRVPSSTPSSSTATDTRSDFSLSRLIYRELTPCAWARDHQEDIKLRNGPLYQILNWGIRLCVWTDVIYGIIVLSTVLFVPMWSAIWMVGLVFTGTLACRAVLEFEMYGLREVSKRRLEGEMGEGYYEMEGLMEGGKRARRA